VRAAALEAIGKRNLKTLAPAVTQRLQDSDVYVRVSAVQALTTARDEKALATLIDQFARQDDLKAPIMQAMFSGEGHPPGAIWDALEKAPPEIILQCLDTLEDRLDEEGTRIPYAARFVSHPNRDVSAAALRLLASRGRYTALLLAALKSTDMVKQDAVLDELSLPPGFLASGDASAGTNAAASNAAPNPVLNRLYDAFLSIVTITPAGTADSLMPEAQAPPAEMRAVLDHFLKDGSPRQRFRAAVVLVGQADAGAARFLLDQVDTLSGIDRRSIAGTLRSVEIWPQGPILDLARRMLRDTEDDVREMATEAWLNQKRPERVAPLLAEFSRPESRLNPDDIYGWELDQLAQSPVAKRPILDWATATLDDSAAPNSHKVLAIVLLARSGQADAAHLDRFLISPAPCLRRAAYRALGLAAVRDRLDLLLNDDSALVRAALPFLASPHNQGWQHWFDDTNHMPDEQDFDARSSGLPFGAWSLRSPVTSNVTPEIISGLEKLARDPSDMVRFEAQFALLRLGHPVEPTAFAGLLAAQPSDSNARQRIGSYLENNYLRLGKSYGVLVPLATEVSDSNMPKLLAHFGLDKSAAFTSFAALGQLAPTPSRPADVSIAPAVDSPPATAASFRVIYFYKPGCRTCARVLDMLNRHAPNFPAMILDERNIDDSRDALLNEALSARFRLKDTLREVTPAVFTQAGPLVTEDITFPRLGDLLRKTSALTADPEWAHVAATETAAAQQTITNRYEALSFGVVFAAGSLDGINPCAFATIVFLLSYLQIARRKPREILAVGVAFIAAVFVSFFLIGLGMAQVLERIAALHLAGILLNYVLAGFALVIAVLSFRDAQLAARGDLGEMTLQLPGMLKEQIRGVIRVGARASHFVPSAFGAGVVVSFLGLPCTGQVYLPTILYMLRAGRAGAVRHLLFYNMAFIIPLIIVFLFAWAGMRSETLLRFQKKHISLVKVLTGLLFLLLTAFLLFGHLFVPQLAIGR
jgi:cytochrome c biogenesis protein CcdA/HEAT repeat protein